MRIALVVHQYLPEHVGGTEVYTHSLAEALTRQGHSVTVFFPDAAVNDDSQETIDAHMAWRAPASPPFGPLGPLGQFWRTFRNPETERSYRRMLAQIDPEIVHVQHVQNTSVRLLALSGARPVFLTLHDYWYRCAQGQLDYVDHSVCQGPSAACAECARARSSRPLPVALRPAIALPMAYRNAYITWMLTFVERFIAPSHHVRDQYVRWGMDAGRITVLPNGVDLERLRSHGAGISEPSAGITFGYLGALAPSKGVQTLVDAFQEMPSKARLRLIGDEEAFPAYVRELRERARSGVSFCGPVPSNRVGDALRSIDCLIVPSLVSETYSMVVDEAHAMGVPVVASRIGALTRIRDGIDGRLFDPGNVTELRRILRELASQPDLCRRYASALPRVPDVNEQAEKLGALYAESVAARKTVGRA